MSSRRNFLQTSLLSWSSLPLVGLAQTETSLDKPKLDDRSGVQTRDYWNDLPRYFISRMNEARTRRKAALQSLQTEKQVLERAEWIRAKVWETIGGPFEKTPLNARVVGGIERSNYRIEKIIFESLPGVYVTAHLYVPRVGQPPFPGVLVSLGHWPSGKIYRNYQYVCQTLARAGFVVFAYDPFGQGERVQYLDSQGRGSRFPAPDDEHDQAGRPMILFGATFAQYRVWDGVRALDYLLSRQEVDPQRIGCTGHSGGGTMTMYLAALEPRIKVVVEVEGQTHNLAVANYDPPGAVDDAEQNLLGSLAFGIDRGDLLSAFAPKPLLMCYTPLDAGTTYSPVYVEATMEIFKELREIYGLLGAQNKVGIFGSPLPHDFDFFCRRETYAWFNRWLAKTNVKTIEASFDPATPQDLNCTTTGQLLTSLGGRSAVQLNCDRLKGFRASVSQEQFHHNGVSTQERLRERLSRLLGLPPERCPLAPSVFSSESRQGAVIEEFCFCSELETRVPGWFIKPHRSHNGPLPVILHVSTVGRDRIVEEPGELDSFISRGFAVCSVDLRGLGVTSPRSPRAGAHSYGATHVWEGYAWAGLSLGKPIIGQQVWDVIRCLDYLGSRSDVDQAHVRIVGKDYAGLAALLAAVIDNRVESILLDRVCTDLRSVVEGEDYSLPLACFVPGLLREYDLADLIAALAPRSCWLLNGTDAQGSVRPESEVRLRYSAVINPLETGSQTTRLRIIVRPPGQTQETYLSWLTGSESQGDDRIRARRN